MKGKQEIALFVTAIALGAIAIVMAPRAGVAQQDPPPTMVEKLKDKAPTTKPAGCEECEMCKTGMQTMAKIKDLLTGAKASAEAAGAKDAVAKIDEALKLIEERHQKMHEMMKMHMGRMHGDMMHRRMMGKGEDEKMPGMKCPMCGKMMVEKPKVVNSVCPIMGSKIDPYKVSDDLTREFHGMKVGFCCPQCPPAWDKLSDDEKQKKLDAVTMPPAKPEEAQPMEHHGG